MVSDSELEWHEQEEKNGTTRKEVRNRHLFSEKDLGPWARIFEKIIAPPESLHPAHHP
jgi:hypothetical protein